MMLRQILGQTNVEVTRLGFGCVRLTSLRDNQEAARLLEHVLASGISHFDVARAYGFGRAEEILGEFLRGRRQRVTIATKFGSTPPSGLIGNTRLIDAAKKLLGPFPGLLRRAKRRGAAMVKGGDFSPEAAVQSLEKSLRALKTDYVDLLFLHGATLEQASSDSLMEVLERQVARGAVRALGVSSAFTSLRGDADLLPKGYQVVQLDDDARNRNLSRLGNRSGRGLLTFAVFQPAASLTQALTAQPDTCRRYSSSTGLALDDPAVIRALLLHYALKSNAGGAVLFSSGDHAHVTANARQVESMAFSDAQLAGFLDLVAELSTDRPGLGRAFAASASK
jgi:aryl-alcohol dehydrogenase-like predicted oxidoreductase